MLETDEVLFEPEVDDALLCCKWTRYLLRIKGGRGTS